MNRGIGKIAAVWALVACGVATGWAGDLAGSSAAEAQPRPLAEEQPKKNSLAPVLRGAEGWGEGPGGKCRSDLSAVPEADFYVSAEGKDTNRGTAAAPFATLARARDAVREKVAAGLTKDLLVLIRGGTYPQTNTLAFGPEDSGTARCSITYAAAPGEKVALSGGRKISGWKKGPGSVWTAELPEVESGRWYFRQLFVNGRRAVRARMPNQGWCDGRPVQPIQQDRPQDPVVIRIKLEGGIAAWRNPGDIELAYIRNNDGGRKVLQSIDAAAQTITLRPPHRWAPKCFGFDWYNGVPDGRCYLENAFEFLDSPGEWYLDRTTGILSYWPRPGEDLSRCDVVAPVLQNTLLAVVGTRQRPVLNLHFRGVHVEHLDWPLPDNGFMGLFSCNVPVFRDGGDPGHRFIEAAVEVAHARTCSFRDGGIGRVGAMGLVLREGTADVAVEGNHVQQTGAGGIGLGQCNVAAGYLKAAPPPEPGEYERFRVRNNYVHHCGADYHGATGIAVYRMKHSIISHNLVHDTAYFGMCLAGDQDPKWNFVEGNTVERNHIHHAMQVTQDGAGLYVCFAHAGGKNLIRANLIHNTSTNHASAGLYLDSACSGVAFDHNVVYRNPSMTIILNRKEDLAKNSWMGNLVVASRDETPPEEFVEAMKAYAGLEPAYRRTFQGTDPQHCELHVLDDGARHAWQFDFPAQRRGVLYRIDAGLAAGNVVVLKPRKLDPVARHALKAYSGQVQPTLAPGEGKLLFPMVQKIGPAPDLGLPESATGRDLLDRGLTLKDDANVIWVAYQRAQE
jgi:hypothetical protein